MVRYGITKEDEHHNMKTRRQIDADAAMSEDEEAQVFTFNGQNYNTYQGMVDAKRKRNRDKLASSGLLEAKAAVDRLPVPQVITPNPPRSINNKRNNQKKVYSGPVRRSGRLSSQAKPDYKDITSLNEKQIGGSRKRSHDDVAYNDLDTAEDTKTDVSTIAKRVPTYTKSKPGVPAPHSVRSVNLNVDKLILGKSGLLGEMVENTGKEHVINQSFSLSATPYDQERLANTKLSFNKYCGVQEWSNCVFLWVNLATSDSPNDFLLNGRQITWFGGSRMHDESPVIHKLIQYGQDAMIKKDDSKIILWCRRYQTENKKFTPYVCLGRLGYESHIPGSSPLSFVWNLLDCDGLKHHEDSAVRERFDLFSK